MEPRLIVKNTRDRGRGVFANCRIREGETIEIAPVIIISRREAEVVSKLKIVNFCYEWSGNRTALALGYACFYNHSYEPNAEYDHLTKKSAIRFYALKDISKGQEITHNYNGTPDDQTLIRFT